jgi:hypothetical protein
MSKILETLKKGENTSSDRQVEYLGTQLGNAQSQLVMNLENDVANLKMTLANLSEFARNKEGKLQQEVNPIDWVTSMQNVKKQLFAKEEDLDIAKETLTEWFI